MASPMQSELTIDPSGRTVAWDTRRYPKCAPYYGEKGLAFEVFERNLVAGITDISDEESSLDETLYGRDPGGDDPAAAAGGAAMQGRHTKRLRDLYAIIYQHVENEELRLMAAAINRNGREFWLLLERECRKPITDLELISMDAEWASCSVLASVGSQHVSKGKTSCFAKECRRSACRS